jgi:hypothetical protein
VTATEAQSRGGPAPGQGETLNLLGNDRRLHVVHSLVENGEETTTRALAEQIAETEATRGDATADDLYKSVYVSLQQTHLPKLSKHGIVDYEAETNTVRPGPRLDEVRVYVRPAERGGDEDARLLPVVAGAGLVAVAAARFGAPGVSALDPSVWAATTLVVVLAVVLWRRVGPSDPA